MVRMRNAVNGGEMWVHETRVDEYLAAGHALANAPVADDPPAIGKDAPAAQEQPEEGSEKVRKKSGGK